MWSPSWKLQLLDTCRDATGLHCVTDEATHHAPSSDEPGGSLAAMYG